MERFVASSKRPRRAKASTSVRYRGPEIPSEYDSVILSPENLEQWILHPDEVKPGNFMWNGFPDPYDARSVMMEGLNTANLTESQVKALVAYLYTLK